MIPAMCGEETTMQVLLYENVGIYENVGMQDSHACFQKSLMDADTGDTGTSTP